MSAAKKYPRARYCRCGAAMVGSAGEERCPFAAPLDASGAPVGPGCRPMDRRWSRTQGRPNRGGTP